MAWRRDLRVFDELGNRRRDADGKPLPLPPSVVPPFVRPAPAPAPRYITPWSDDGRDPMELLSRLAGTTTHPQVTAVRAQGAKVTTDDIAAALGYVDDPLAQRLALAIACQTVAEWPSIQRLARGPVLAHLRGSRRTRELVAGHRRYRAQVLLYDVFHDLALLRPVHWRHAAQRAHMREMTYQRIYEHVAAFLEASARTGAAQAMVMLFGD